MSSQLDSWISKPGETNGPLMSISCWTLLGCATVFLALRLYVRYGVAKLWLDDVILTISWVFLLVFTILNQLSVNLGFGNHALDVNLTHLERITYYGATGLSMSNISINLSKISFGVTLLRLTSSWAKLYTWFAIITLGAFAVPTIVLPWTLCKPLVKTFIDFLPGTCVDKQPSVKYAQFQAIWSALMDISLACIPWTIIWGVQMRLAEKIGIGIAMSLGLLVGAVAIVRANYLQRLTAMDLSYDAAPSIIWASVEGSACIIATSIPVLRAFLKNKIESTIEQFNSSYGSQGANHRGVSRTADSQQTSRRLARKQASQNEPRGTRIRTGSITSKEWIILDDMNDNYSSSSKGATR